ncbi:MAG: hypothetical protein JWN34_5893 [Bryobacterales bacterium]|nr:hypothetical protein [Bryobacterales bacterium]
MTVTTNDDVRCRQDTKTPTIDKLGSTRFVWLPSLVAATLWIVCAGTYGFLSWYGFVPHQFLAHFLPETIPSGVWQWTWPWPFLVPLASALVVFFGYLLLAGLAGGPAESKRARFFGLWFVAVAAGFLASASWAISAIVTDYPPQRAAFVLDPAGDLILLSGYWGIVWGWLPALAGSRGLRSVDAADREEAVEMGRARPSARRSRRTTMILAALVVVAMSAAGVSVGFGSRAARLHAAELAAIDGGHTVGAFPDPDSQVTPPPDIVPAEGEIDPSWCSPDQAMVLLGDKDAATGHRALTIRANNFSDVPCVLDGYPDIAFADANGSEIGTTVTHGGSFMTDDAGASPVIVQPGGYAKTTLGWSAMPTDGVLATYELHAAMYPGLQRGSWPITLDITAGGEVAITAWTLSDAGPSSQ